MTSIERVRRHHARHDNNMDLDDGAIWHRGKNTEHLIKQTQLALDQVVHWTKMWGSTISASKNEEDFQWEPPSEAEMKVIQARRERQDKISKLMGDYLLKGYKMLGDCCDVCGTILLQDRQQKNYCVSCQELDSDVDKDNPALNAQAALSQVRERQLAAQAPLQTPANELNVTPSSSSSIQAGPLVPQPRPEHCEGAAAGGRAALLPPVAVSPPISTSSPTSAPLAPARPPVSPQRPALQSMLQEAEDAVLTKLRWATTQLQSSASLEASIQLCSLITSCANSLRSLKELSQ